MSKVYIAGPMTGYKNFNFDAFFTAEHTLKKQGWEVFNPANKDAEAGVVDGAGWDKGDDQALMASGWDFKEAFLWDCSKVIESDAIYMLKGWEKSSGARAEHAVAIAIQARYPEYKIIYA